MANLDKAILIATQAHQGQKDRYGANYILHPLRVMFKVYSEEEKIVAILHDVIEKTDWTLEELREQGFSEGVVEAVNLLTRRDDQDYMNYIEKLKGNYIARKVKLADIEDNMNPQRMDQLSDKNFEKLARLHKAWIILKQVDKF
jgi:(p)ppGpp synthase/HD superfamily hydrolase